MHCVFLHESCVSEYKIFRVGHEKNIFFVAEHQTILWTGAKFAGFCTSNDKEFFEPCKVKSKLPATPYVLFGCFCFHMRAHDKMQDAVIVVL